MNATISHIGTEITSIISDSKNINPTISEQERINKFLDHINKLKSRIVARTEKLKELDALFTKITWLDLENEEEEKGLKEVIHQSKKFHSKSIKDFTSMKKNLWQENICRSEINNFKDALDDFEDSVFEVEQIFFSLRKNDEFNDLINSL